MLSNEVVERCIGDFLLMAHFPRDPLAVKSLARHLSGLCADDAEALTLTARVVSDNPSWPGLGALKDTLHELRNPPERRVSDGTDAYGYFQD